MAKTTLDRLVEEIKTLEPEELLRLRDQLDAIIDSVPVPVEPFVFSPVNELFGLVHLQLLTS